LLPTNPATNWPPLWAFEIQVYIHLINLRSFGTPYLSPLTPLKIRDLKDIFIRVPWPLMNKRPAFAGANRRRQNVVQEDEGD